MIRSPSPTRCGRAMDDPAALEHPRRRHQASGDAHRNRRPISCSLSRHWAAWRSHSIEGDRSMSTSPSKNALAVKETEAALPDPGTARCHRRPQALRLGLGPRVSHRTFARAHSARGADGGFGNGRLAARRSAPQRHRRWRSCLRGRVARSLGRRHGQPDGRRRFRHDRRRDRPSLAEPGRARGGGCRQRPF